MPGRPGPPDPGRTPIKPEATMIRSLFLATLAGALQLEASNLPELSDKKWIGSWIGHEENRFEYSVAAKSGHARLVPKVRGKDGYVPAGVHDKFEIYFILEEMKGGEWTRLKIVRDGFETTQAASAEVESCELVATYEGGSKAKIRHRFERKSIALSTSLEHKASANPTRVGILILTPSIYQVENFKKIPTEEEIEKMMKDDEIRAVRVDGKSLRFKLHEKVVLSDDKLLGEGASQFSIETKRYGGEPIRFGSVPKDGGKLLFRQSKRLYQMFGATWYPSEGKAPAKEAELVIAF